MSVISFRCTQLRAPLCVAANQDRCAAFTVRLVVGRKPTDSHPWALNQSARSSLASRRSRAFTLIEMLVATVLAAVLLGANLMILSRLGKDRAMMSGQRVLPSEHLRTLLEHDAQQADTIDSTQAGQLIILGHGSIDPTTLLSDQRWCRIIYRLDGGNLYRVQQYLDDPARPRAWTQWIGDDISGWTLSGGGTLATLTVETRAGMISVERRR